MSSHKANGCRFNSLSGHMPGLQVWSWSGHVQEATDWCFSHMDVSSPLSPSLPLSLKLNKQNLKNPTSCGIVSSITLTQIILLISSTTLNAINTSCVYICLVPIISFHGIYISPIKLGIYSKYLQILAEC